MEDSFIPQSSHGIMDEQEEDLGSFSSFDEDDDEEAALSTTSSSSELMEDAISPSSDNLEEEDGSLFEMSGLIAHLPLKRGLSKHFQGKSQSFSSLCNVSSLEDLAKPERSYKKKLKSSKSYGGGLDCHKALSLTRAAITKKPYRASFSSLGPKRHSFFSNNRPPPPIPPQRSPGNLSSHALLFA